MTAAQRFARLPTAAKLLLILTAVLLPIGIVLVWLGDPDDMARRAARAVDFTRLKLKLGAGDGLDVERVRAVREVV